MVLKNNYLLYFYILFNCMNLLSWEYNVSDIRLKGHQLLSFDFHHNKLIMFRTNEGNTFYLESIDENGLKSVILEEFKNDLGDDWHKIKFKFDYDGNIWFASNRLCKYSNEKYYYFDIFDNLDTNLRKIIDFEFDKKGNIWIATEYEQLIKKEGTTSYVKGYCELFKFGKAGLELIKFDSVSRSDNYEFLGYQYMDRAKDGTIFLSIIRGKDNLLIIEDEKISFRTLDGFTPSPLRNVTDFEIENKDDYYVTYKKFYFLDGDNSIRFGGISHYKNGVWKHFDVNDGLPMYDKQDPNPYRDTNEPADVYSVCLDNVGNHYFTTVGAILKITKDNEIIVYDGKNIVKNSQMYAREYFNNSFKDYVEPIFTNIAKVNNKLYATVMYGILEIDEGTLSVNKKANKQLKVFPNPIVNDYAIVELPENEIINSISIIDLSGVKIDAEYNLNSFNIELDCSKLSNGTYIVLTRTNKDLYFSKLIVKRN